MKKAFFLLTLFLGLATVHAQDCGTVGVNPNGSTFTYRNQCFVTLWGSNLKDISFDPAAKRVDFMNTANIHKNYWYAGTTDYEGAKGLLSMLLTAKTYSLKFKVFITSGYHDDNSNCSYTSFVLDPH